MLQGGNLAGLVLKVFQISLVLLWNCVYWPVQKAHKIGGCCINACKKGGSNLALSNEPLQVIIPQRSSGQLVI